MLHLPDLITHRDHQFLSLLFPVSPLEKADLQNLLLVHRRTCMRSLLMFFVLALDCSADVEADPNEESVDPPPEDDHSDIRLFNAAKPKGKPIPPGDIRCVMSKASTRHVNFAQTQYHVSFHDSLTVKNLSIIDQGAIGDVAGEDVCVIFRTSLTDDIKALIIITSTRLV
jgi:hypothetical protein